MMKSKKYDVIVIGGGASGMMAAGRAAELGKQVFLIEKNVHLGEKLKITGGGRCNITNAEESVRILLSHYGNASKYLFSPFSQFGIKDTFLFFEGLGLPLIVQAGKRAFPKSENATDVFEVLNKYMRKGKVDIMSGNAVKNIVGVNGKIEKIISEKQEFTADSYILATGGKSHPETGSTGDGFTWLKNLGHTVSDPTPMIVPLAVRDQWIKRSAGSQLKEVKITFFNNGKKAFAKNGNILCTHFGISGPLILNAAGAVADLLHEGNVTATIDIFPKLDHGSVDKKILQIFEANKNKQLKNVFKALVPPAVSPNILSLAPLIDPEIKVHSVSKEQRKILSQLLKALPLTIEGLMGFDRAVIADGGVAISEVDPKTMRSKLYKNLYITGDLLHISRPSGGYSLQLCWTTGYIAGSNV